MGGTRSAHSPALAEPLTEGGLADGLFAATKADPDAILFRRKDTAGHWRPVGAAVFVAEVLGVARGLLARGVSGGDRVGLMARTRYEWTLFDYAIWAVGGIGVPIYPTSAPDQVRWILADSGAVACVTELPEHTAIVAEVAPGLPVFEIEADAAGTLTAAGADTTEDAVHAARAAVTPESVATIVYTSGTTGRPKGCVLTHANFVAETDNAIELLEPVFRSVSRREPATLLFLPLAHSFGRMVQVACVRARACLGHAPSLRPADLRPDLRSFRPTFLLAVPYFFERVHHIAFATAEKMGRASSFRRAERIAIGIAEYLEGEADDIAIGTERQMISRLRRRAPLRLRLGHVLYDLLVYRRIRAALGGRCRYAISGGSPLGRRLTLFFAGAGVLVFEGYGLTETTAAATVNPPLRPRFGTVGRPLPGTEIRLSDGDEILIRGAQVLPRYWNNETASAEAVPDGWLRTGDLGTLDEDGYLTVTGRAKDLIITSGGKNVAPAALEDVVRSHWLVGECVAVGDGRPYVAALITVDPDTLDDWRSRHPGSDGDSPGDDPELLAEIQAAVDEANAHVSRAESIRRFTVLDSVFSEENGLMTPSRKPRRAAIRDRFAAEIDALYAPPAARTKE